MRPAVRKWFKRAVRMTKTHPKDRGEYISRFKRPDKLMRAFAELVK